MPDYQKELEDFASGFTPQQGSTLAPSVGGGLPLGGTPPTPPQTPAPTPSFQRAPLISFGGQAPDLNQMIAENLRRIQAGSNPAAPQQTRDAYLYALHELPKLQALAGAKSQERQLQRDYLKEISGNLKEWTGLTTEQRFQQKGLTKKLLQANAQLAGLKIDDADVEDALSSENVAGTFVDLFDPTIPERDQLARLQRLGSVKGKDREEIAKTIRAEDDARAQTTIAENLPDVIRRFGSPDKPIDVAELDRQIKADPQISQLLKGSPVLARNLTSFLSNEKNAETLAGWGVKVGKTALKEQELRATEAITPKFPNLEPYTKTLLPFMVKGAGLAHGQLEQMAKTDPNRFAAIVSGAQDAYQQKQIEVAAAQGREGAKARLEVPEKASPAERKEITELAANEARLSGIEMLYKPEYVGPITGRAGMLREEYTGQISPDEAEFRSRVKSYNNYLIKQITGAQMSEKEADRIKGESPQLNLPPVTFDARLRQSRENNVLLQYKTRMILEQTGVDVSKLPPLPPLPPRFRGHPELFNTDATKTLTPQPRSKPPISRSGLPTRTR